jgi:hypothetical protein
MAIVKVVALFIAVLFTLTNIVRVLYKNDIPVGNFLAMSIGIVVFIVLQFDLLN